LQLFATLQEIVLARSKDVGGHTIPLHMPTAAALATAEAEQHGFTVVGDDDDNDERKDESKEESKVDSQEAVVQPSAKTIDFYTTRGIALKGVEVRSVTCVDSRTQDTLLNIIQVSERVRLFISWFCLCFVFVSNASFKNTLTFPLCSLLFPLSPLRPGAHASSQPHADCRVRGRSAHATAAK
jgi:hypothetical protein